MILVIGGAYQGKLAYAQERFSLTDTDVFFCNDVDSAIPQNKRIINELDKWILALLRADKDVQEQTKQFVEKHGDSIVICNDISSGVVPTKALFREWREAVGRSLSEMARGSDEVIRLFCGIPTRIK